MNQCQLKPATAEKLKKAVPGIEATDLALMQGCPMRSFDPLIMQDPLIYRLVEAMQHYGQSVKNVVNDLKGDGIISAESEAVLKEILNKRATLKNVLRIKRR